MVNIDTVYQKVLALANKEQRGYITPQEFNLFADQAQMEIFEQYFYDLDQIKRSPGNNGEYSDVATILKDKISIFEHFQVGDATNAHNVTVANNEGDCLILIQDLPLLYRLGEISVHYPAIGKNGVCEQLTPKEFSIRNRSKLSKHDGNRPVFVKSFVGGVERIKIYPFPRTVDFVDPVTLLPVDDGSDIPAAGTDFAGVSADFIRRPATPNWSYIVAGNSKALYNLTASTDFELHRSEESELIYRILGLAGIAIEKPQLTQVAAGLEQAKVQQEKQ